MRSLKLSKDAARFLQGYLTCDTELLAHDRWVFAAWTMTRCS